MEIEIYQVDAFADKVFNGNPAAICILTQWLPDNTMQAIATENNLPETAFLVEENNSYLLRWFTPAVEVDLCGHATLASAYVVFKYLKTDWNEVTFKSNSGPLIVKRQGKEMCMDFPALPIKSIAAPQLLMDALKIKPLEVYESTDYLVILKKYVQLKSIQPNFDLLKQLNLRAVIISTVSDDKHIDFVSRFFAPKIGILEDPITGSAHCALVPYWAKRLNKTSLYAQQITSKRIALRCELSNNRVLLFGEAICYLKGKISIN